MYQIEGNKICGLGETNAKLLHLSFRVLSFFLSLYASV